MKENYIDYIKFFSEEEIKALLETDKNSFIGVISKNIRSHDELMHVYFDKLNLAPYFGGNWNALDEVLTDFDWINAKDIIIVHLDLPKLDLNDQKLMLETLSGAVKLMQQGKSPRFTHPTGKHKLQVIFPKFCQKEIKNLIN